MIQYYHRGCDSMKPLLIAINAKYIHTNNAVRLLKANSRFKIDYIEFTTKDTLDDIVNTILDYQPTLIGFSTYIWNIEIIKKLVITLKKHLSIPIILGGPEVSYDAETFINELPIDLIAKGESEHIFDDIIDHFHNQKPLTNTPNITTKNLNHPIEEIDDLSRLKSPHFEVSDIEHIPNRINYLESSRGCPYNCSYCLSSLEKKVRFFPLKTVQENLLYLIKHNAKTIKFLDRTFNANRQMLDLIDTIILHHKPGQSYQFEITADRIDEAIINHIHSHAPKQLFRFEIGIQSTHPLTNKLVDRTQDNTRLFNTIKTIIKHDIIDLHLDLIAGLPKEDLPRFKETFNTVFKLGAKELQLGFLKMLRGTKIRAQADYFNYQFNPTAPYEIISNDCLSKDDLQRIHHVEATLNLFHNKGHFGFLVFEHAKEKNPFDFFESIYQFTNQKKFNLHRYQLDELYQLYEAFLLKEGFTQQALDEVRKHYLMRSNIKPKVYFPILTDKTIKHSWFEVLHKEHALPLNDLFKYSICVILNQKPHIFYYQNNTVKLYTIRKPQA